MKELLSIKNLTKSYDKVHFALKGVSLDVYEGEFVVIIGPSGSGKSTLLRCINQLVRQSSGTITFRGNKVEGSSKTKIKKIRREIGMIFQHYNLIDRLTVIQNVLHGRLGYMNDFRGLFDLYSREDRWNAFKILERVGLADQIHKRADQLSGGQKQRVGISRALAQKPALMLADEPIASLDPVASANVMNYLYGLCHEENIAGLVSLHQVDFALKHATRIIGLKEGLIIYDGKPEGLTQTIIDSIYENEKKEIKEENETAAALA